MSSIRTNESAGPTRSIIVEDKKFLWDGGLFESHDDALRKAEAYKKDHFEIYIVKMEETYLVYSRRVVKGPVVSAF